MQSHDNFYINKYNFIQTVGFSETTPVPANKTFNECVLAKAFLICINFLAIEKHLQKFQCKWTVRQTEKSRKSKIFFNFDKNVRKVMKTIEKRIPKSL